MSDPGEPLRLVSFAAGERGYVSMLAGVTGAKAIGLLPDRHLEASSSESPDPGRATLRSEEDEEEIQLSWTPAGPLLEFSIGVPAARVYAIAASALIDGESLAGPGVAWELPPTGFSALRTIWVATEKRGLVVLVAGRPDDAVTHDEELIGAARLMPDADPYGYDEPLLSTEYDGSGAHVRATLELWPSFAEHVPERGGGLLVDGGSLAKDGHRLEAARFSWSLEGAPAVGGYEIVTV
jgi:hypothetical protein